MVFLLPLFILFACGYRFSGSGELPAGVKTVFINIFENSTIEADVEKTFTDDLVNEFILSQKDPVREKDQADAILQGRIESIYEETISNTSQGSSLEREVTAIVSVKLSNQQGALLWSSGKIAESEAFIVGANNLETNENKQKALINVSKKLAQRIYNRLTEDF